MCSRVTDIQIFLKCHAYQDLVPGPSWRRHFFGILAQFCSFAAYCGVFFGVIPSHILVLLPHPSLLWHISMHFWPSQRFLGRTGCPNSPKQPETMCFTTPVTPGPVTPRPVTPRPQLEKIIFGHFSTLFWSQRGSIFRVSGTYTPLHDPGIDMNWLRTFFFWLRTVIPLPILSWTLLLNSGRHRNAWAERLKPTKRKVDKTTS